MCRLNNIHIHTSHGDNHVQTQIKDMNNEYVILNFNIKLDGIRCAVGAVYVVFFCYLKL